MASETDRSDEYDFETDGWMEDTGSDEFDEESEDDNPFDADAYLQSLSEQNTGASGFGFQGNMGNAGNAASSTSSPYTSEETSEEDALDNPGPAIAAQGAQLSSGTPCCVSLGDDPVPDDIANLSVLDDGLRPVIPVARLVTPLRMWLSSRDGYIVVVQEYCTEQAARYARETWVAAVDAGLTWPGASPEVNARFLVAPTSVPEAAWESRTCIDCTFKLLKREMQGHWTVEQMSKRIDMFAAFDRKMRNTDIMIHPGSNAELARDVMLIDGRVFMMDPTVLLPCPTGTSFSVLASPYEEAFEVDVDAQPLVGRLIRMIKKGTD